MTIDWTPPVDPVKWKSFLVHARDQGILSPRVKCLTPKWENFINGQYRPCRRCTVCLTARRNQWAFRIQREMSRSPRVWFLTLTYNQVQRYSYSEVQRFLKRVRKSISGRGFTARFICTDEFDSKGSRSYHPHHHLLIFTANGVTRRDIEFKWDGGHSKCKLASTDHSWYVSKYLLKTGSRVRASALIGKPREGDDPRYNPARHMHSDLDEWFQDLDIKPWTMWDYGDNVPF